MGSRIAQAATSLIGTPFEHQGRRRGRGVDCAGLVIAAFAKVGVRLNDERGYAKRPPLGMLERLLRSNFGNPVATSEDGDVVLLWIGKPARHIHCGIVCGSGVVHVLEGGRVQCDPFTGGRWARREVARFRMGKA